MASHIPLQDQNRTAAPNHTATEDDHSPVAGEDNAESADLEIQFRMQSICDLLEKLPKNAACHILVDVGFMNERQNSARHTTHFALIAEALQYLHEAMHRGDDLTRYESAIRSQVQRLVDMGLIADPWDDGEEETNSIEDLLAELVSYLAEFSAEDLVRVLSGIKCSCFLQFKDKPLTLEEMANVFGMHLQHQLEEGGDLAAEAKVMRGVYNKCGGGDADSHSGDRQSSRRGSYDSLLEFSDESDESIDFGLPTTSTATPRSQHTRDQLFERVDKMMGTMLELPRSMVVNILRDARMMWTFADPESKDTVTKHDMVYATADFLRNEITLNGVDAAGSIEECEVVIQDHVDKNLRSVVIRPLLPRGREWHNSKKFAESKLS